MKLRIQRWHQGEAGALWKEAVKARKSKGVGKKRKNKKDKTETEQEEQDKENARRCTKLVQEVQFSFAAKALISRGIDQSSEAAKAEIRNTHTGVRPLEIPEGEIPAPPIRVSASQVKKAVKASRRVLLLVHMG